MNRIPIRPGTARRLGIHPPVDPALFAMQDRVNLMVWQLDFIAQAYRRPWRPLTPWRPSR
jgi:hypothetical protein